MFKRKQPVGLNIPIADPIPRPSKPKKQEIYQKHFLSVQDAQDKVARMQRQGFKVISADITITQLCSHITNETKETYHLEVHYYPKSLIDKEEK